MPGHAGAPPATIDPGTQTTSGSLLLVASSGGHLTQLMSLTRRFVPRRPTRWVTFETDQSTIRLKDEDVTFVPYIPPRAWGRVARTMPTAWRQLRRQRPDAVVSTGAAIALAYLPLARMLRIETHYIESATRAQRPSMTGRVLRFIPGIHLHTQHEPLAVDRWTFIGSVFEGFEAISRPRRPLRRVVVALGTIEPYQFRRLVERLVEILPNEVETVWQTGATDVSDFAIDGRKSISSDDFEEAIMAADVIIAHAGTGTALTCLELGKRPILVPRRSDHNEHIDDHQRETADYLAELEVVSVIDADDLRLEDLEAATGWCIQHQTEAIPIELPTSHGHRS